MSAFILGRTGVCPVLQHKKGITTLNLHNTLDTKDFEELFQKFQNVYTNRGKNIKFRRQKMKDKMKDKCTFIPILCYEYTVIKIE